MNLMPPDKRKEILKQRAVLLSASLAKLATLLGATLPEERLQLYLEPLHGLNEEQIERSFKRAAKEFIPKPGHLFPAPAELIEFSKDDSRSGLIDDTQRYLNLEPPDKTPMTAEEARSLLKELKSSQNGPMKTELEVYFDGSCGPGNPGGTAAYGFVVYDEHRALIHAGHGRVVSGPEASNNVGEYGGLLNAMKFIAEHYPDKQVMFNGDSELVINQMNGRSKARKGLYLSYYQEAAALAAPYIEKRQWRFQWIPRDMNSEADELSQYSRYEPLDAVPNYGESLRKERDGS